MGRMTVREAVQDMAPKGVVIDPAAELRWWALGGARREAQLIRAMTKSPGTRAAELAAEELDYMRAVRAGDAA